MELKFVTFSSLKLFKFNTVPDENRHLDMLTLQSVNLCTQAQLR